LIASLGTTIIGTTFIKALEKEEGLEEKIKNFISEIL
jgi:hypothetical protein